ncbi:hypothetical protein HRbin15_02036 [bacterium HR15]|nr:hypothetical protein HRbin15_02036 [bacterium HR15]
MRWYILSESERPAPVGNSVAVAVAFDMMEAALVCDYLRERHIRAFTPTMTPPYPYLDKIYVWVPAAQAQQATLLLQQLAAEWQEELVDADE